jgi:hypothetical protein
LRFHCDTLARTRLLRTGKEQSLHNQTVLQIGVTSLAFHIVGSLSFLLLFSKHLLNTAMADSPQLELRRHDIQGEGGQLHPGSLDFCSF